MTWLAVGRDTNPALPMDRLSEGEQAELQRLATARRAVQEQALLLDHRIELLILAARDARGLIGKIQVNMETGMIRTQHSELEAGHVER